MFKFIKKISMAILIMATVLSSSALAMNPNGFDGKHDKIFDYILHEYMMITGVSEQNAQNYYAEFELSNHSYIDSFDSLKTEMGINSLDERSTILYIQENYPEIEKTLSREEKEILNKFLLNTSIEYYCKNLSEDDLSNLPTNLENTNQPSNFPTAYAAANVCRVTLFADDTTTRQDIGSSGLSIDTGTHAWLMFKNISSSNIVIGGLTVAPNKSITIGTWGNQPNHNGVWYNLEGYYMQNRGSYTSRWSVSTDVTSYQLSFMSTGIKDNDMWSIGYNCSSFATSIYSRAGQNISCGIIPTPKNTAISIRTAGGVKNASCSYYGIVYRTATNPVSTSNFRS